MAKKQAKQATPEVEHHEATVQLSGAGNEAPHEEHPDEPRVVQLDQQFVDTVGNIMDETMNGLDKLRADYNIPEDDFPGVLYHMTTDFATTYMAWREYKADPEAYVKRLNEERAAAEGH